VLRIVIVSDNVVTPMVFSHSRGSKLNGTEVDDHHPVRRTVRSVALLDMPISVNKDSETRY
jgi:hypothetical protein